MISKSKIMEEYVKCITNTEYAIETYLTTFDKTQEGFVPFKLFPKQREIIKAYDEYRNNIITKPRQAGISTTTQAYAAIKCAFAEKNNPERIIVIANKLTLAKKFLKGIREFIIQLPRWVWGSEYYGDNKSEDKEIFITDSQIHIVLPNGSEIIAVATSTDALRGFTPTFLIFDEAAFIDKGAELYAAAVTSLGCLTKESLILTENGLITINELVKEKEKIGFTDLDKPYKICNRYGDIVDATQTFVSDYGETYKIKTKLGIELEGSWKHPILINRNGEDIWVKMNELTIGDKPIISYNQNYFNKSSYFNFDYSPHGNEKNINIPTNLDENLGFAYLIGLFISKGHFMNGGIGITNTDSNVIDFLINDGAKLGCGFSKTREGHYYLSSIKLVRWFEKFGLKKHSAKTKEIPLLLLKMSKNVIKTVLMGMFDGDGSSTKKEVKYSSTSKKLIKTLQILLLNYGIISHIKYSEYKTSESSIVKNKNHICKIYDLKINSNYVIKFYKEIGFKLLNLNINDGWFLSLNEPIIYNENYYIDEIVSIDVSEDYTYDLHVPDTHSFISNGIISHNTGGKSILISCVTEDTFIQTTNGLKQVSDFIDYDKPDNSNEGYFINDYEILGKDITRKSNIMVNNGLQETIKLVTTNSFLEGTKTHKLWVYDGNKKTYAWKSMGEISKLDYVNIQYGHKIFGDDDSITLEYNFSNKEKRPNIIYEKIDKNLSYLIGLYLSEGSVYKVLNNSGVHIDTNITLTCGDDISKYITNAGFNYSTSDNLHYTINSKYLGYLLEHLGLDLTLKAKNKFISNKLLSMSEKNIKYMIRGFMDGDGYSDIVRGRVGINISSKKMCLQIRHLLMNFGILTDYQEGVTRRTKLVDVESRYYRISATSIDARKYYNEIGFSFKRKMVKNNSLKNVNINNRYRIIPNGKNIIKKIINDNNLKYKFRGSGLKLNTLRVKNKTGNLSENIFIKFIDYIENVLTIDIGKYHIDKILIKNSKWVQIKSITKGKSKTYDFSLPNDENDFWCHSVLYNNILGHQTPNGMDPLYYKTYEQAQIKGEDGKSSNGYNVIEMKWYQDPRYNKDLRWKIIDKETGEETFVDELEFNHDGFDKMLKAGYKPTSTWYNDMCKSMNFDSRRIAQELDVSFLGSGGNVILDEYIIMHENENVKEPLFVDDKYSDGNSGQISIWAEPEKGHQYVLGCLPPGEKVLTNNGLKNIEKVKSDDKLINENGDFVDIINKQIYPVINEDVYEIKMSNTFRKTKFTKEHPILISKPILKENKLNKINWDFNFNYTRMEEVEIGDWVKVPNIYKKDIPNILNNKWVIKDKIKYDNDITSPLTNKDFWWFIGLWLGNGSLFEDNGLYGVTICFEQVNYNYIEKCENIIKKLFKITPSTIDNGTTIEIIFNSDLLYHFIKENFGHYSYNKKITEWVKYIPNKYKEKLISGYFTSNGCWSKINGKNKLKSKVNFVNVNLSLLESIQDIIFSLGFISSLNKLRNSKLTGVNGNEYHQKKVYSLTLDNNNSLGLIKLFYNEENNKLTKFNIKDFSITNKQNTKHCFFNNDKSFIYFRVKGLKKTKFTGNVYNFECDTHTFMCHHITTHNCDVARGDGADYSTIVVVDFTTMEQVMEYQGKIPPDLLAEIAFEYGTIYDAYMVVDIIGVGVTTVLKLVEMGYPNLHYDKLRPSAFNKTNDLSSYSKNDKIPGFNVNGVRLQMISNLEANIRLNTIKIRSKKMCMEMKTFIYKNGKPDHMEGYHDDLLMSLGMILWVIEYSFKSLRKLEGKSKAMLTGWVSNSGSNNSNSKYKPKSEIKIKGTNTKAPTYLSNNKNKGPNGNHMWLFSGYK